MLALRKDGMAERYIGKPDNIKKYMSTAELEACVEDKRSMEARGMTLPAHLHGIFESSSVILSLRRALINGSWAEADALLEMGAASADRVLHEACRSELDQMRNDQNNRWIVDSLKKSIMKGRFHSDARKVCHRVILILACR